MFFAEREREVLFFAERGERCCSLLRGREVLFFAEREREVLFFAERMFWILTPMWEKLKLPF